jgi:hypothetical protein
MRHAPLLGIHYTMYEIHIKLFQPVVVYCTFEGEMFVFY